MLATLSAIEADLGEVSAQKALILAGVGRKLRDLAKIEEYLDGLTSIVNKKRKDLIPIVARKHALLESIRRDLEAIGLERRTREAPDIGRYLAERYGGSEKRSAVGEGHAQAQPEIAAQQPTEAQGDG